MNAAVNTTESRRTKLLALAVLAWLAIAIYGVEQWLSPRARAASAEVMSSPPRVPRPTRACDEPEARALHGAHAALGAATARSERYAFAAREGITALTLFSEARACATLLGDERLLATVAEREASLLARMERDLQEHATRYRWARRAQRLEDAREDIAFLIELLRDSGDPSLAALRADRDALDLREKPEEANR